MKLWYNFSKENNIVLKSPVPMQYNRWKKKIIFNFPMESVLRLERRSISESGQLNGDDVEEQARK